MEKTGSIVPKLRLGMLTVILIVPSNINIHN